MNFNKNIQVRMPQEIFFKKLHKLKTIGTLSHPLDKSDKEESGKRKEYSKRENVNPF